jgi:hypothetical protein
MKTGFSMKEYPQGDFYNEIMHLRVLPSELKRFFTMNALPSSMTDDQTAWRRFMYYSPLLWRKLPWNTARAIYCRKRFTR